jgi:hypothetical protein
MTRLVGSIFRLYYFASGSARAGSRLRLVPHVGHGYLWLNSYVLAYVTAKIIGLRMGRGRGSLLLLVYYMRQLQPFLQVSNLDTYTQCVFRRSLGQFLISR